jgi:GxxExxY protein
MTDTLIAEELTGAVIGAFFEVYNILEYGFLENVYMTAMERELTKRGHSVERERPITVFYKGEELCSYRIDMLVDETLVIETKSTEHLHPTATRQLYSYLKATEFEVGLLLHFGVKPKFYRQVCSNKIPVSTLPESNGDSE